MFTVIFLFFLQLQFLLYTRNQFGQYRFYKIKFKLPS